MVSYSAIPTETNFSTWKWGIAITSLKTCGIDFGTKQWAKAGRFLRWLLVNEGFVGPKEAADESLKDTEVDGMGSKEKGTFIM